MANPAKRLPDNVTGDYFVDSTCIDCDTCRQLAPNTFGEAHGYANVRQQPVTELERRAAARALLSCPTGSIGGATKNEIMDARADFPMLIDGDVYYCGYTSPKSYGGGSYFVRRAEGNWLIDSPKFLPQLVRAFEAMGGIAYIFLTHRDDVADADRYAARFGSKRIIHKQELSAQPDAEIVLEGTDVVEIMPGFVVIPTPGHTKGHCVLLRDNRYLFTGDHLWGRRGGAGLGASQRVCWYSWPEQTESMKRLMGHTFDWVLPGHGHRVSYPAVEMRERLGQLVEIMETG